MAATRGGALSAGLAGSAAEAPAASAATSRAIFSGARRLPPHRASRLAAWRNVRFAEPLTQARGMIRENLTKFQKLCQVINETRGHAMDGAYKEDLAYIHDAGYTAPAQC